MPTLHWIGKDKVINHHRDVPYKVLEHQYTYQADVENTGAGTGGKVPKAGLEPAQAQVNTPPHLGREAGVENGNMIIQGDNLEALKSLLPKYEGKVKCIYIDPPYNTGNEGWVYNDNVNDPRIKKWLGDVVGKEGEDLSRHDKWLCMMYPRLVLLHKLLAEDGVIFMSIDDDEVSNARFLLDEVFGKANFIATICWQKKQSPQNDAINFSDMHDYVLVYARRKKGNRNDPNGWNRNLVEATAEQVDRYKNPDNDERGPWASSDCTVNKTKEERPNLYYALKNPITGDDIWPSGKRVWLFDKGTLEELLADKKLYFGKTGKSFPRLKVFLGAKHQGLVPSTWWPRDFAGDNQAARREFRDLFPEENVDFSTPKPTSLCERILQIGSSPDSIILDSFAGSGTTAHAVLNLNKQDGGNRKFILIEMMDYADTITAERVKRVMNGYPSTSLRAGSNKKTEGTGGAFDYYTLGEPLFDAQHNLNEAVDVEKIREYIWYSETRSQLAVGSRQSASATPNPYYLGTHEATAYYFVYEKDALTTVDHDLLATLPTKGERTLIYADNCLLPKKFMEQHGIVFKKIPRDITRF